MKTIRINTLPGYEEWRDNAKSCLLNYIPPSSIIWKGAEQTQDELFKELPENSKFSARAKNEPILKVPKSFVELAQTACCHNTPERFALLYKIFWRINFENRKLLNQSLDDDLILLNKMVKEVRRDSYKITAFLRFRETVYDGREHYVAWYEPFHYTLERSLPFFTKRFRNMNWSILTPYRAAHWDGKSLFLQDNPDPSQLPEEDKIEKYWLTYYAGIFNPARVKKSAMLAQMPKKYWTNLPEAKLIPDLLQNSEAKAREMIDKIKN